MDNERRVGVLVRISDDRIGDAKGVQRQRKDCQAKARERGWTVVDVYEENDTSAYRRRAVTLPDGSRQLRVVRPEYRRLLADLGSGRLDGFVAYDLDRVARDPRDLEDLIDVVEAKRLAVAVVTGEVDLSSDAGIFMARTMVNVANKSSRDTARRVRRKLEENAIEGRNHGGSRPFGWKVDRVTLEPAEAAAVRKAAALLLAGNSVRAIVRALSEDGSVNTAGTPWRDVTLRGTLLRPRNAGLRVHQGNVIGEGQWEPILDRDTWERVRVTLMDPGRRTTPGASGRKHLLSGLLHCGVCGEPCRVAKGKPYKGVSRDIYRCSVSSCVSRDRERVDELVRGLIVERLGRPDAVDLFRVVDDGQGAARAAQLRALRGRLEVAAADYADGLLESEQLRTITARLRPQIDALEAQQPRDTAGAAAARALAEAVDAAATWDALDVSVRRRIVDELLFARLLTARRGPTFDPQTVEITWKDGG